MQEINIEEIMALPPISPRLLHVCLCSSRTCNIIQSLLSLCIFVNLMRLTKLLKDEEYAVATERLYHKDYDLRLFKSIFNNELKILRVLRLKMLRCNLNLLLKFSILTIRN